MLLPRPRAPLFAALLLGCGFDSGGVGGGGDASVGGSSSGGSATSPTGPSSVTEDPSASGPSTVSASGTTSDSNTDPSATDPTVDPTDSATTDPDSTGQVTSDGSTGDPTAGTSSATSVSGDSSSGAMESTGGDPNHYAPCAAGTCAGPDTCVELTSGDATIADTCAPPCLVPGDCPVPETGDPEIQCPAPGFAYCVLHCDVGTCPDGMACHGTNFGNICFWDF